MTNYVALKAEIAKPAYSGLSDAQIVVALNTTTIASEAVVSGADVGKLWARRGVLATAHERARRTGNPALSNAQRATAWEAIMMVEQDGFSGLDPTDPKHRAALVAFLDRLVTDTILSAGDKAATLALLARSQTTAQSLGWPHGLGETDIVAARAM